MTTSERPIRELRGDVGRGRAVVSRELPIQVVGVLLIGVALDQIAPLAQVLTWIVAMLSLAALEGRLLRRADQQGAPALSLRLGAATFGLLSSAWVALAAYALIVRGGPPEHLLALVLLTVSMLRVLMRHYHSRPTFFLGVTPQMVVLLLATGSLAAQAIAKGLYLAALTPIAALILPGMIFWAARAQLFESWRALAKATAEAREGERTAHEASLAKSNFLATMGHELRTPLNGMLGMAQAMAVAGSLNEEQRSQLKVMRRSGESLSAVLNDLLDLSKIETGELDLEISEFDLEHLVRGSIAIFAHEADKKRLAFNFAIDAAAKGQYRGDGGRVRQVLYNLLSNAVKFTEAGAIAFTVRREGHLIVLRVDDTGIGIAPHDLGRLFDSFFQADAANTRRYAGAGLGLTICQELVGLMGGRIVAASAPGEGSTFTVTLPLERIADVRPMASPVPTETTLPPHHTEGDLRVLAAEDNEVNQLVLKTLLAQAGVVPVMVVDGAQAVTAWESESWDIILMDIQMPRMDGVQAAREIRRREIETGRPRTPILAVTANAMVHQVAAYEAAGMDGVAPKPIEMTRLFAAMEAALAARDGKPEDLRVAG